MDAALRRSDGGEERRGESSGDGGGCMEDVVLKIGKRRRDQEDDDDTKPLPNQNGQDNHQLESTKAEMGVVKEENQRLKMNLNRIMKDYQTLQMQFFDIVKHESKEPTNAAGDNDHRKESVEEPELVSLSLGRISTATSSDLIRKDETPRKGKEGQEDKEALTLGLEYKFEAVSKTEPMETSLKLIPENSSDEVRDIIPKTVRSGDDDVLSQQNHLKKARVSVRVRCDTPTMNDGCQWRKYGQKIAKGNPCPRAYYRCTVAPSCPVRKQVQRCAEDMSILITTYEGTHNHPLTMSATAMASTTSAAAAMLLSGSSSSGTTISASDFRGMNFYHSDNVKQKQFYVPNNLSISSSPSHPTITLDLTSTSSSSTSSHFNNKFSSHYLSNNSRYSSTNLNFSSLESNPLSMAWSNNMVPNNYGTQPFNKNQIGSLNFGRQPQENFYNSFMQKTNLSLPQQPLKADTIASATKAITSDPNFQSALAAALTSIMGASGGGGSSGADGGGSGADGSGGSSSHGSGGGVTLANHGGGNKFGQNLKLGEPFPVVSNFPSNAPTSYKCSSSYLNGSTSATNSQPAGSMVILQPPLPFSSSKSKSTSPGDRDHII